MNFDFIPFKLNADLSQFKSQIHYISSDNGVELYKAGEELKKPINGISISDINLYFFEGSLITVYIHLGGNPEGFSQMGEMLQEQIGRQGKALKTDLEIILGWVNQSEFLGLVSVGSGKKLYLYYTLRKYSVF